MERGNSSVNNGSSTQPKSDSSSTNIEAQNNAATNNNNNGDNIIEQQHLPPTRDEEVHLPLKQLTRIMRRAIPPRKQISNDAKKSIQLCVSEFISLITSEANERCMVESRRIVTGEDLLWAMDRLGFDDYVGPLGLYLQNYRNYEGQFNGKPILPGPNNNGSDSSGSNSRHDNDQH